MAKGPGKEIEFRLYDEERRGLRERERPPVEIIRFDSRLKPTDPKDITEEMREFHPDEWSDITTPFDEAGRIHFSVDPSKSKEVILHIIAEYLKMYGTRSKESFHKDPVINGYEIKRKHDEEGMRLIDIARERCGLSGRKNLSTKEKARLKSTYKQVLRAHKKVKD